jgi:hypothetical protein
MFVCVYSVFVLSCVGKALRRADHSSKESYQLSISVRLRNLIRGGQGSIWAAAPLDGWMLAGTLAFTSPERAYSVHSRGSPIRPFEKGAVDAYAVPSY